MGRGNAILNHQLPGANLDRRPSEPPLGVVSQNGVDQNYISIVGIVHGT